MSSVVAKPGAQGWETTKLASLYVIAVWLDEEFDTEFVRARIRLALPRIEALTLAVPPFDGPEGGGGAQQQYG